MDQGGIIDMRRINKNMINKVYESLRDILEREYNGKFVAITYDGKILASSNDNVDLLIKLKDINYPSSKIFISKVGAKAVAGWF